MEHTLQDKKIFWGCFIALTTTSMAFIFRAILIGSGIWPEEFGLDAVQASVLFGAGIWPFAISIILFSLIIDSVGYRFAMFFSFFCYVGFVVLTVMAYAVVHAAEPGALAEAQARAWNFVYWGSIILGLGNGTVEAFINPVVATLFKDNKTKWLNILHAGWPAGLVGGGVIAITLSTAMNNDWRVLLIFMVIPSVIYVVMLFNAKFPVNERVAAGSSYRDMLAEFGIVGALIGFGLIFSELGNTFDWAPALQWGLVAVTVAAFGFYSHWSIGNPVLIVLVLIMMPLATTELGTDGAITGLMEGVMQEVGWNAAWVLVYTSAIMMVLRFNAGPVIQKLTPLGLLITCTALAMVGLFLLSKAQGVVFIFAAATLYGVAKTYFWPTMLGVVSEQTPRGGALTLNAIAGIGMLAVGILGQPVIGYLQESSVTSGIQRDLPEVYEMVTKDDSFLLGDYVALDMGSVATQPDAIREQIMGIRERESQGALAKMTLFPATMLIGYIGLFLWFRSQGGYKPKVIGEGH